MSQGILIAAVVAVGLGFFLIVFKMLKKGAKFAKKLPTNFLIFFLIYALLGLTGFFSNNQIAPYPILLGILLFLVSLSGGIIMMNRLYEKWEWSIAAGFWKKLLYLFGITLTSIVAFTFVFLLCEHREIPKEKLGIDIVWWLASIILVILLPLLIHHLYLLWLEIPKISQIKQVFKLPLGTSPPFIETGGAAVKFQFIIPFHYQSKECNTAMAEVPLNKTLEEAFHYKLHEHNIVKRYAKKIVVAENNKKSKVYGWSFYRMKKIWWGWWTKKFYLNPKFQVGAYISNGEKVYVERVKIWEQ